VKLIPLAAMFLATGASADRFTDARAAMVAHIRAEVRAAAPAADDAFLEQALTTIATIPREDFVPADQRERAYAETALPIGEGQTISDAYIVAVMTAALRLPPHANVLDVGTGSGYQAAVLARVVDRVASVEIVEPLARAAAARLARLGFRNVAVRAGDGYAGWPERAPFDGVVVAAGASEVPPALVDQLKIGGRLVMPIGASWAGEQILVVTRTGPNTTTRCSLGGSMFVPLTGRGERREDRGLFDQSVPLCYSASVARADVEPVQHRAIRCPRRGPRSLACAVRRR